MKIQITLLLGLLIGFTACKKDRISDDNFSSMDEFFDANKVEEQEFIITSEDTVGHITGNQGSKLYVGKHLFKYVDRNDSLTFPYSIKLVELYKYKDIIFYQMPTPHANGPLFNGGEIRVRAYKNAEELMLKPGLFYRSVFSSVATETDMSAFQGQTQSDKYETWEKASDGSTTSVVTDKYEVESYKMGWLTPAKNRTASTTTDIEFTVTGNGGENISLAICFKDFHCVLMGKNLELKTIPVGESATIIAMAKDQNGGFRLHQETVTTSANMIINLDMKEITEAALLTALDGL